MDDELSPVERIATLLEAVEAGQVGPRGMRAVVEEFAQLLADLVSEPVGWVEALGYALVGSIAEPPACRAAGSTDQAARRAGRSEASGQ